MALKENYKDDILDVSQNVKRKYQMENNGDGTVSFTDVTEYTQQGDSFGASDLNAMAHAINTEIATIVNDLGAKNMLPNNATSQVVAGITYTINSDGSITISGTSTASNGIVLSSNQLLPKGTYKTTTGQAQEEGADAFVYVQDANTQRFISRSNDFEVPSQFTLANDTLVNYGAWVDVGKTVNVTIYPMVRPASIADDTYAPYAQTNKELTDNLSGFKFYPAGTQFVAYIEGHGWYNADGKYVIWGTATANALVEASPNTYYGRQSEEDCRGEAGADTAIPFNKENPYQFNIYRMQTSAGTYDQVQQINEPQLSVIKTGSVENDVFKYVYSSHTITAKTSLKLHYKTFGVNDQTYPIRLADMTTRTLNANETFTIPFGGYNGAASFAVVEV